MQFIYQGQLIEILLHLMTFGSNEDEILNKFKVSEKNLIFRLLISRVIEFAINTISGAVGVINEMLLKVSD